MIFVVEELKRVAALDQALINKGGSQLPARPLQLDDCWRECEARRVRQGYLEKEDGTHVCLEAPGGGCS